MWMRRGVGDVAFCSGALQISGRCSSEVELRGQRLWARMEAMDLRQLREETRPEHEATEASMPLMSPDLTVASYAAVLRRLLPVVAGWERWAEAHAPAAVRPLLPARRRSHLLEADLQCLGADAEPNASVGAPIDWMAVVTGDAGVAGPREGAAGGGERFEAGFLGAMYVLEGSTLGGRFIARHVEEALALRPGCGNAYFQGHGDATGRVWRETTALLTALPQGEAETVIAAARRTFRAFGLALGEAAPATVAAGVHPMPPGDERQPGILHRT